MACIGAVVVSNPLRPWQPGLGAHRLIAALELRGGFIERHRRAANRHALHLRHVAVDVDKPAIAFALRKLGQIDPANIHAFTADNVILALRMGGPRAASGVGHP